jgi:hypothetical protein
MPKGGGNNPAIESTHASTTDADGHTRLHIRPFDPELLKVVLNPTLLSQARNISYHSIEAFPESRYGFLDLPAMEAEKLRRKLNGTTLKGSKLRIEKARADTMPQPMGEEDQVEEKTKKKIKKASKEESRKRKRDGKVTEGIELDGRKVKRGWTEPEPTSWAEKKKKSKSSKSEGDTNRTVRSKYTDRQECLFKAKLPRSNTGTEEESKKGRKKRKNADVTLIHEFENTSKFPTFLKNETKQTEYQNTAEFVEGKGWVDSEGQVVETIRTTRSKTTRQKDPNPPIVEEDETSSSGSEEVDDSTSSSGASESESESTSESEDDTDADATEESTEVTREAKHPKPLPSTKAERKIPAVDVDSNPGFPSPLANLKAESVRPKSSSSNKSLTIMIPPATPSEKVHPLEALYKRNPAQAETPNINNSAAKPFTFFDNADEVVGTVERPPGSHVPMTPFTRQDFEWRHTRSAAPTPDTAHPNRTKPFWAAKSDEEEGDLDEPEACNDDEHAQSSPAARQSVEQEGDASAEQGGPNGNFQKWFWENRRDLNRSWMKRRKTSAKEKRHRDNKARASRAL